MNRINQSIHFVVIIMIITVSLSIFALIASSYNAYLVPIAIAYSEATAAPLTFKHYIQTSNQSNICIYSISVLVLDSEKLKPISNALVEFKTPLTDTISNKTDLDGGTVISLTLEKEPHQESCTGTLHSQGYSIEAFREGYEGYGFGSIS